ncbi:MAG: Transcriptional regulator, AraC family, partial [uncultured Frankineae bacterium]
VRRRVGGRRRGGLRAAGGARLGAGAPRDRPDRRRARCSRADVAAQLRAPLPQRHRLDAARLAPRAAAHPRPAPAGGHRAAGRRGGPPQRARRRHHAAPPLLAAVRHLAAGLPADLPRPGTGRRGGL